ncbi:MAG: glycosyltransferase [Planctomycetota bacterium]
MSDRSLRVLHCPTDVGGNPIGLARAERALGVRSTVAVNHRSWLQLPVDIDLGIRPGRKYADLPPRILFLMRSLLRYDVFHFNFGQTFLPSIRGHGIDLPLLRMLRRRLFVTYQGCDARQSGWCQANFAVTCCDGSGVGGNCDTKEDASRRDRIRFIARYAHRIFALNPDLLHVLPAGAEFVPYASVFPEDVPVRPRDASRRPVVLHAPTNRAIKGTDIILSALESARREIDFEIRLVEGVPHARAMEMYRDADLLIDQLRIGWYGGLAVELMAMGTPTVCYLREQDLKFLPPAMRDELPVVRADAKSLAQVIVGLLADEPRRRAIGAASRRFVERWHDPRRIAGRMVAIYRDPSLGFWSGYDPDLPAASLATRTTVFVP